MAAVSSPNWLSGMILAEILPATSLQFSSFPEILWPTEYSLSMNSFFCAKQLRVVSVACNKKPKKDTARNDIRRFLHRCKFETHYLNSDNSPTRVSSPLLSSPEPIYPKQINKHTNSKCLLDISTWMSQRPTRLYQQNSWLSPKTYFSARFPPPREE